MRELANNIESEGTENLDYQMVSEKLLDIGVRIKSSLDQENQQEARFLFDEFVNESTPIIRGWLEGYDRKKAKSLGKQETQYVSLVDDAMQDAYLNMFQHFDRFNKDLPVMGWLYTISRNAYISQVRKQFSINKVEQGEYVSELSLEKDLEDPTPGLAEQIATKEVMGLVENIITGIKSENLRKTAQLIYVKQLDQNEVIEELSISKLNYNQRVVRIRREIARVLENTGFDNLDLFITEMRQNEETRVNQKNEILPDLNEDYAKYINSLIQARGE